MIRYFEDEYEFLSNSYPSIVQYIGISFHTVEHAFQAAKTLDKHERIRISKIVDTSTLKFEGRMLKLREDWEDVKYFIMEDLIKQKFSNPVLKEMLLETDRQYIQYCNSILDKYWGVSGGVGLNKLGKILMNVREQLNERSFSN